MKYRIVATVVLILALAGVAALLDDTSSPKPVASPKADDSSLRTFKIE